MVHVAELDQREQEASGGGPRQAGAPADVAEREPRVLAVERPDHRQATLERLDEVVAALFGHDAVLRVLLVCEIRTIVRRAPGSG